MVANCRIDRSVRRRMYIVTCKKCSVFSIVYDATRPRQWMSCQRVSYGDVKMNDQVIDEMILHRHCLLYTCQIPFLLYL